MPIEIIIKNAEGQVVITRTALNFEKAHAELERLEVYIKRLYKQGLKQNNVSQRTTRQRKEV